MKILKIIGLWLLLPIILVFGALFGFELIFYMVVAMTKDIWKGQA